MSALCLYVSGLIVATPCKTCHPPAGGWRKFSVRFARYLPPPDQKAETASDLSSFLSYYLSIFNESYMYI